MKKWFLAAALLATFIGKGQSDKILGKWLAEKKDAKVEVYKKDGQYYGKIIWLQNDFDAHGQKPKRDVNNPDPSKRQRPIVGSDVLMGMEWDADDKEWDDGEIYDPRNGKTYSVFARLEDYRTLYIKGYIGFSIIGRSTLWTRIE